MITILEKLKGFRGISNFHDTRNVPEVPTKCGSRYTRLLETAAKFLIIVPIRQDMSFFHYESLAPVRRDLCRTPRKPLDD